MVFVWAERLYVGRAFTKADFPSSRKPYRAEPWAHTTDRDSRATRPRARVPTESPTRTSLGPTCHPPFPIPVRVTETATDPTTSLPPAVLVPVSATWAPHAPHYLFLHANPYAYTSTRRVFPSPPSPTRRRFAATVAAASRLGFRRRPPLYEQSPHRRQPGPSPPPPPPRCRRRGRPRAPAAAAAAAARPPQGRRRWVVGRAG